MAAWNCYRLFVTKDEKRVVIYDPVVMEPDRQRQILIQDFEGNILNRFAPPSRVAQAAFPLPNYGFCVDESRNLFFQVNAHEYKIYVYDETGQLVKTITNEAGLSKCKSLPYDFRLVRDYSESYEKRFRAAFNWIEKLYIVENRLLLVIYYVSIRPNPIKFGMDVLSLRGDFVNPNLALPELIRGVCHDRVFLVQKRSMDAAGNLTPVEVKIYKLHKE